MPRGVYERGLTRRERYLAQVDRSDSNGCWPWTGPIGRHGYGTLAKFLAHRFGWEMHFGPIPEGLWVLHSCDNPPCCRPDHWFLGTHEDNMADMQSKGRRRGRRSIPAVKIRDDQLGELPALRAQGMTLAEIGKIYGCSGQYVGRILAGVNRAPR